MDIGVWGFGLGSSGFVLCTLNFVLCSLNFVLCIWFLLYQDEPGHKRQEPSAQSSKL